MEISAKSFLKEFYKRVNRRDGTPLCYLEFQIENGGEGYNSRIAIYDVDIDDYRTSVCYKYVDRDNKATGVMDEWSLSDTSYFMIEILSMNCPEPKDVFFPRTWLPLLRVG